MLQEIVENYRTYMPLICGRRFDGGCSGTIDEPDGFPHTHPEAMPFDHNLGRWHLIRHNYH